MTASQVMYTYATVYAVPHVHAGARIPVGVIMFAPTHDFLGIRVVTDESWLHSRCDDLDVPVLARYLQSLQAIVVGDPNAGPLALWSLAERFHWMTAYRSDVLQSGPVHEGLCDSLDASLDRLFHSVIPAKAGTYREID